MLEFYWGQVIFFSIHLMCFFIEKVDDGWVYINLPNKLSFT